MDGSVSTLAPVFAAAVATTENYDAFLVGLAASIGAGISMGFAEALSDDGSLTGRGRPWMRGLVCGLMTALGGSRAYAALPDFRFPRGDERRHRGGAVGTRRHHLDPPALYGYADMVGGAAGRVRRRAGVCHRDFYRKFVVWWGRRFRLPIERPGSVSLRRELRNVSPPRQYHLHGKFRSGPALRVPHPAQSAPVHFRRRALARPGNRRQHRHLHAGQSADPATAAGAAIPNNWCC